MRPLITLFAAIGAATLGGCAATASPGWDSRFGDSARTLAAQQLIDPAAPARNAQSMPATDGRTTRLAADSHVDSYRNPPSTTVVNIGVGGGGGAGR